jgi:tripartite-type tricarboxylate transporter receptor subunit TctC
VVAERLGERLGQPVVVLNRPGAAGVVGVDAAVKSAPDGYTLFTGDIGTNAINAAVYRQLPFDMARDIVPVSQIAAMRMALMVNAEVAAQSVGELVALARA